MPWPPPTSSPLIKRFRAGTHRLRHPAETVEALLPLLPVLGITRLANITGLDTVGIPVVSAYRPNSRSLVVAQGKGVSLDAARASGLMESVELFTAERITLPVKLASQQELRFTHKLVDVNALPQPPEGRFHANLRLLWIEGHDLLHDEAVWLPFERVHIDCTLPMPAGAGAFQVDSNGLASGNHPIEATLHGLCEVVERDSYARFLDLDATDRSQRRLDLDSIDDAACQELCIRFARASVYLAVWELTSHLGIPAFLARALDVEPRLSRRRIVSAGMGCHPCRELALSRALTEAAQTRLTIISGARDDLPRSLIELDGSEEASDSLLQQLRSEVPRRAFEHIATWQSETLDSDLSWLLERLRDGGLQRVIVVDLSHPQLQIPVVRVVVPGLRGLVH